MTHKIKKQILKVRNTGRTNMLDTNGVMYVANAMRLYDLVVYLDDRNNRREYWRFIMGGETTIEGDDSEDEDEPEEPYYDPNCDDYEEDDNETD